MNEVLKHWYNLGDRSVKIEYDKRNANELRLWLYDYSTRVGIALYELPNSLDDIIIPYTKQLEKEIKDKLDSAAMLEKWLTL